MVRITESLTTCTVDCLMTKQIYDDDDDDSKTTSFQSSQAALAVDRHRLFSQLTGKSMTKYTVLATIATKEVQEIYQISELGFRLSWLK